MKKLLGMLLAASLLLTGCGGKKDSGSTGGDSKTLTIAVEGETYNKFFTEAAKEFEGKNEGVKINIVDSKMTDLLDALPMQKGNSADMFMTPHDRIGDLSTQKLIAPVTVDLKDYTETAQKAATFGGSSYILPFKQETTLLFYNKDLVQEAPKYLSEIPAEDWLAQWTDFYRVGGLFFGAGGYVFKDENVKDLGLNNDGAVKAGQIVNKLYNEGGENWGLMKDETVGLDLSFDKFKSGEIKYIIEGPWKAADMKTAGINYGVAEIPAWDASTPINPFSGTTGLAINGYSKNVETANEFLSFLATKEYADKWVDTTNEVIPRADMDYGDNEMAEVVMKTKSTPMPSNPEMSHVWDPMKEALMQIATKSENDVKPALDAAVEAISSKIAE